MTESQSLPQSKAEFVQQLVEGRHTLWQFIDSLSERQWASPRDAAGWAIKDHLANLAAYEQGIVALLNKAPRWRAMGLDEAFVFSCDSLEPINAALFALHQQDDSATVVSLLRREQAGFDTVMTTLDTPDLLKTYSFYQPAEPGEDSGAPIMRWLVGNTYDHYAEHLPWMQALRDSSDRQDEAQ